MGQVQKKSTTGPFISIVFGIIVSIIYISGGFIRLQYVTSDIFRTTLTGKSGDSDIVYLLITDSTLIEADEVDGVRWPWPRSAYSEAIRFLKNAGAREIVFDMIFSETSVHGVEDDEGFADALNSGGGILATLSTNNRGNVSTAREEHNMLMMDPHSVSMKNVARDITVPTIEYFRPPVDVLLKSARGLGDVKFLADSDGIGRRMSLVYNRGDKYYPSLALAVAMDFLGVRQITLHDGGMILKGEGEERNVPLDRQGMATLKYYGDSSVYEKYLLLRVIKSQARIDEGKEPYYSPSLFKDKIVLIGSDATELKDLRPNPFNSKNDPGVHYHGTAIDNILKNDFLVSYYEPVYVIPFILLSSIAVGLIAGRLSAHAGFLVTLGLIVLGVILAAWLFRYRNILVDFSSIGINIIGSFSLATVMNYLIESRQRNFITGAFGHYLSPAVIDRLVKDPSRLKLGGEKRVMTAFFSDVAGFSTISEKLQPEELVALLNDYLTEMCEIIGKYSGTVDKFEGDAIIAFWGAPLETEDHALLACSASIEMQERLVTLRRKWSEEGRPPLRVRIGINTGPMLVGNLGSRTRMDYTIMGDSVNLASRLEGANKFYGTMMMISEFTYEMVREKVHARELDMIRVVGKEKPVRVYELIGFSANINQEVQSGCELFQEALSMYRKRMFAEAAEAFEKVFRFLPEDPPSMEFIRRCSEFAVNAPDASWDGVYKLTGKG